MTIPVKLLVNPDYARSMVGIVFADDAQALGIEVVGAIAQIVDPTQRDIVIGHQHWATGGVDRDGLATQIGQCGGIIDTARGQG